LEKGLHRRYLASGLPDPKADGRLRPLGIASWEDKIVARVVVEVLNAVYEVDFTGFS
jgi:RNA-directed DNA polymerase